jgi:pimeloyl-ACP methyl ester carboxylesterase
MQPVVHDWPGWTDDEIRSVTAPTFLVIGDQDFVRLDHAAEMLDLFPDCRLAVLPDTKHTEVMQRSEQLRAPRRVLPGLARQRNLAFRVARSRR